ncbi:Gfo/Idh/MocA family protein [Denitrobaculum tricleocarpae]|nr:Gfo/Idh/MocA family oxidoreductase [Denitrobaculum tricleocarpae]
MSAPDAVRVLVVGLGNMGLSHADAYHRNAGFEIVGLVNRSPVALSEGLSGYPFFESYEAALKETRPDLVSVNTYTDSHVDYAIKAMDAGAHVFVEKPLAATVADAERVVETALRLKRKMVIGYILRHHPSWVEFIAQARRLGPPYVMRMNLNQQSSGDTWSTHKRLMESTSPIVDCGVHYVDVMCQITDARPTRVHAMGVRLSDEVASDMYNYGHLQVLFDDGSNGWYEAAWGPMISETAYFVKDVMSPGGCVSIIMDETAKSDDIDTHTKTAKIKVHSAALDASGAFSQPDEMLSMADEPGHQALCDREQAFVLKAIREDLDLGRHLRDAVQSLRIVLAADQSVREGRAVEL